MPKPIENTDRVTFFLPREKLEEVKKLASDVGVSVSAYVRMVMIQHLNEKNSK